MTAPVRRSDPPAPAPAFTDLSECITVQSGALIVQGATGSVVIPTGGAWPGLFFMTGHIDRTLNARQVLAINGTTWTVLPRETVTPELTAAGTALVTAQMLTHGGSRERWKRAVDWYGQRLLTVQDGVAAAFLNVTRKTVNGLRNDPRNERLNALRGNGRIK